MLEILCTQLLLFATVSGWGALAGKIFRFENTGLSRKLISGIVMISFLWTVCAFFLPLNLMVELFTIGAGISAFFIFKINQNFIIFLKNNKISVLLNFAVLFSATFPAFILDHLGYYVPTVKWLREFGLVKGIANLDLLLGQMSVWHIFQAGFSSFADPFLRINSFALIIYIIYIFEKRNFVHLLFFPVLLLFVQSPSPDLPAIILSMILLNEILTGNREVGKLFTLAIFIFIIKLTMIWPPMLVLGYVFIIKNYKIGVFGILFLMIFFVKNIWCFGYPIFPVQILDLGISWKPNPEVLKISSEVAVQKTFDMQYSVQEISHFSKLDFVKNWLFLPGIKSIIHIGFIFSLIIFTIFCVRENKKILWLIFISILIKSILVLIFSAQYRFFIDVFFVIFFVLFYDNLKINLIKNMASAGILISLLLLSFPNILQKAVPSFRVGHFMAKLSTKQFLKPIDYSSIKSEKYKIGNLDFNVPTHYPFCYNVPLPAISPEFLNEYLAAGIFPQMNGNKLSDGFHWRKMTAQESERLKKIIAEIGAK